MGINRLCVDSCISVRLCCDFERWWYNIDHFKHARNGNSALLWVYW